MSITVTPLETFRTDDPYPFCPGCGHGSVLDSLNEALVTMALDPAEVVIVSDIGCAGLSDQYFTTSAFHGLHGRSTTYASGIKLARPDLTVIVLMGDGGTGIGGSHLISAARRNVGVTVVVMNNFNFGMTGGQHSNTTPEGSITATTPGGNLEHPIDICATVGVNGAGYVYRGTSFDKELPQRIVEAIQHPGFALLDVWDLCTAYFVPKNKLGRKGLDTTMDILGFEQGVLYQREVADYSEAYRQAAAGLGKRRDPVTIPIDFESGLEEPLRIVAAGSAGAKVRSAVRLVGLAAIRSGLWATQRDDFPVTVKAGHSISQLVLSPEEMPPVGVAVPDVLVLVSADGLKKVGGMLEAMRPDQLVVTVPEFASVATDARLVVLDPKAWDTRVPKIQLGLMLMSAAVALTEMIPLEALRAAAAGRFEAENLNAIEAGVGLAG
jgi:pyruvate/2-oxoacid:ferredoxin oxidoreductase beta subunit/Pyruvate/2-oxoacid:ferredoxin oxidoreductase gamma subunit